MSRLIRDDLHIKAYRRSKRHLFTPALKEIRHTRTERLLQWHAEKGDENSHLKDEKIFTSRSSTSQNDNIYAQTSREAKENVPKVHRGHHPSYVVVWWRVSRQGVTPLRFCEKGVKTGARMYQEDVLQGVVQQLNTAVFSGQKWVVQYDSAPAHKTKTTQE
jgi:hypothetical protein